MLTADTLLCDAGWLFLAVWSVIVIAFSVAAFREDLLLAIFPLEPERDAPRRDVRRP